MEESIKLLDSLKEEFACEEIDIRTFSPLTLAYIGDCIFDLVIRSVIVLRGNKRAQSLHKEATSYVNAGTQSLLIMAIQEELTQEEQDVFRRGRNAKSYSQAKNASLSDYKRATGLEALMGYLYLTDKLPRAIELIKLGLDKIERKI